MRFFARIFLGLLVAFAAIPAQACPTMAGETGHHAAAGGHGEGGRHHRPDPAHHAAEPMCVGCVARFADPLAAAMPIIAWDAPAPFAAPAGAVAEWRVALDLPPPRAAI